MGTTALSQLLTSLCTNSPWKYAVLWKLRHGNPTILSWEDGYCVSSRPRDSLGTLADGTSSICASEFVSSNCATFVHDSFLDGYDIETVLVNMSQLLHPWGEGVIGEAAYSGNHLWVSTEDFFNAKLYSMLISEGSECPEEWLCQFAAGIKTVVVAPVLPHGVVQLGSTDMVAEDLSFIANVRNRFITYGTVVSAGSMSQSSSTMKPNLMERLEESSVSSISPIKSEDSSDSVDEKRRLPLNSDVILPLLNLNHVVDASGKELPDIFDSDSGMNSSTSVIDFSKPSSPLNQSSNSNQLDMEDHMIFDFSSSGEEFGVLSVCNGSKPRSYAESFNGFIYPNPARVLLKRNRSENNVSIASSTIPSSFLNFPKDSELHKALGTAFQKQINEYHQDQTIRSEDILRSCLANIMNDTEVLFTKGSENGYLLEAVLSNNPSLAMSSTALSREISATSRPPSSRADSPCFSQATSAFSDEIMNITTFSTAFGTTVSSLADGNEGGTFDDRKAVKTLNGNRRIARPGDNQRPRPRDRQLIQDRVKELRELVPNGSKCSIDGLLEKTIKHMLYLKSVTKQVDKLNLLVDHEVDVCQSFRPLETNTQVGTSWAFDIGGEQLVCPITIEDLPHRGHMLIEMLCDEHSLFLEVAKTIRSLDLNILKAAMETRSNNKWAQFIVELMQGSKGFHRLDIFWPLMQLLQRQQRPISSKI